MRLSHVLGLRLLRSASMLEFSSCAWMVHSWSRIGMAEQIPRHRHHPSTAPKTAIDGVSYQAQRGEFPRLDTLRLSHLLTETT